MTRVNCIPVWELADQHLIAEYRELPRCIKQDIYIGDAPEAYCLGKGHMKWAKSHSVYLIVRYYKLCEEMKHRGFKTNYSYGDLVDFWIKNGDTDADNFYHVTETDKELWSYYNIKLDQKNWSLTLTHLEEKELNNDTSRSN